MPLQDEDDAATGGVLRLSLRRALRVGGDNYPDTGGFQLRLCGVNLSVILLPLTLPAQKKGSFFQNLLRDTSEKLDYLKAVFCL